MFTKLRANLNLATDQLPICLLNFCLFHTNLGLYSICRSLKVPWIICKSIGNWADGEEDKNWRNYASAVSASYVEHVLRKFYVPGEGQSK